MERELKRKRIDITLSSSDGVIQNIATISLPNEDHSNKKWKLLQWTIVDLRNGNPEVENLYILEEELFQLFPHFTQALRDMIRVITEHHDLNVSQKIPMISDENSLEITEERDEILGLYLAQHFFYEESPRHQVYVPKDGTKYLQQMWIDGYFLKKYGIPFEEKPFRYESGILRIKYKEAWVKKTEPLDELKWNAIIKVDNTGLDEHSIVSSNDFKEFFAYYYDVNTSNDYIEWEHCTVILAGF